MGYKSTLRSISAAGNKASREAERNRKRRLREAERLMKKHAKLKAKQEKAMDALKDLYAKDKIDKKEFDKLKKREEDIEIHLYVFGGTPGVNLAKQYLMGKIDKVTFDEKMKVLLPESLFLEKDHIYEMLTELNDHYESHVSEFDKKSEGVCSACGVTKGLFRWLYSVDAYSLCRRCKKSYLNKRDFSGYVGQYFSVGQVNFLDPGQISVGILEKHILKIR